MVVQHSGTRQSVVGRRHPLYQFVHIGEASRAHIVGSHSRLVRQELEEKHGSGWPGPVSAPDLDVGIVVMRDDPDDIISDPRVDASKVPHPDPQHRERGPFPVDERAEPFHLGIRVSSCG